jgi:tetratricopeptide (TPR) repeat protein
VAKANPLQLKRDADAAEKKGDFVKAIELLKQIVQESSKPDWNTVNRIGDLYAKLNKLKEANEQYVKVAKYYAEDGFYLKAIAVWKKVLRNEPSLLEANRELGDLYARQGLVAEAKQTFGLVFNEYINRGRKREAADVLRRLAELDPSDNKVRGALADLYAREGQPDKAAGEYVAIAEELVKKGKLAEALQFLDKPLRSGPRSPRLLVAYARVCLVQKDYARAIEHLEEARRVAPADREVSLRLAEACLGAKRPDDARRVLEGLLERDPADQEARLQLGQVYLAEGRDDEAFEQLQPVVDKLVERRQLDRGIALLQQIVQRNPSHVRTLAKLVELYRQARNDMLVAQTYSQMVEAYLAGGGLEQAASILEMLVQLEPHNEQHRSKLRWLREQKGPGGFEVDLDRPPPPPMPPVAAAPPPAGRAGALELSPPPSVDDEEFIREHLGEGRIFRKYGLGDKAKDQFEAVLARFPDNLEALQELVELHREKGESEAAAQRLRVMAEVQRLRGNSGKAAQLDAEADSHGAPPAPAKPEAAPAPVRPAAPAPAPAPTPAPTARGPAAPLEPAAAPAPAPVLRSVPLRVPPAADLGVEITVDEPAEETELFDEELLESGTPEPGPSDAFEGTDLAPPGDLPNQFLDDEGPFAGEPGFDFGEPAPAPPPPPVPTGLRPQGGLPAARAVGVPADLRRAVDEIESYLSAGFVEDAKGILNEFGGRLAGHPALVKRLAKLGFEVEALSPGAVADDLALPDVLGAAPSAPPVEEPLQLGSDFLEFTPTVAAPPSAPPEGDGGEGFDLASELGDLFGAQPAVAAEPSSVTGADLGDASLADIFREFQKGVDRQLGKEDYETRYNLGIAYKEMGLVDEAIAEFQLAAKDEGRLLECASMLGMCFVEKGMPKLAVKWFDKGLSAPGRTDDEYKGIRYDLADAHEQGEEPDEALALFEEVFGQDASFRDVAARIERLREKIQQRDARH